MEKCTCVMPMWVWSDLEHCAECGKLLPDVKVEEGKTLVTQVQVDARKFPKDPKECEHGNWREIEGKDGVEHLGKWDMLELW